jgi:hypothetical protein
MNFALQLAMKVQKGIRGTALDGGGRCSVNGMATGYGLDGPGIESRQGEGKSLLICPDRPWVPPSLLYNGYRVSLGNKKRPGRDAEPSPTSNVWSKKEQKYTSTPSMGRTACTEPQCLYSRAIALLPLWTVRPLQSLSACTIELHLYFPYGPYGL